MSRASRLKHTAKKRAKRNGLTARSPWSKRSNGLAPDEPGSSRALVSEAEAFALAALIHDAHEHRRSLSQESSNT